MRRGFLTVATLLPCLLLAACGGGGSNTTPPPTPVSVTLSPSGALSIPVSGSQFFSATVTGSTNTAVTWTVNGVTNGNSTFGTINTGNYIAPATIPSPATFNITATAQADTTKSATASVTITIGVSVSPASATVNLNQTQPFTATILGATNIGVDWSVSGVSGGNTTVGTIDANGNYTAPAAIPDGPVVQVTATSLADPTQSATAPCTISAGGPSVNQASQNPPNIELGTSGGNSTDISGNFCCSGTLGSLVVRAGTQYILSNNHVLAKSDKGTAGNAISQPGLVDNNCSAAKTIANLTQWVNLEANKISSTTPPLYSAAADAAIAQVVSGQVDTTGKILQLGTVDTTTGLAGAAAPVAGSGIPATIGMQVAKSGRTSGLTCSTVAATNITVQVDYESSCGSSTTSFTEQYANQIDIMSDTFSAPGDSGSLIVDAQTATPVGLLYAGSDTDTVANNVSDVLNALKDSKGNAPTFVGVTTPHTVEACTGKTTSGAKKAAAAIARVSDEEMSRAITVKENHVASLMSDPAVIGVGVGAGTTPGTAAILILVEKGKTPRAIPAQLDGVPTKVRYTKRFKAFDASCGTRTQKRATSY